MHVEKVTEEPDMRHTISGLQRYAARAGVGRTSALGAILTLVLGCSAAGGSSIAGDGIGASSSGGHSSAVDGGTRTHGGAGADGSSPVLSLGGIGAGGLSGTAGGNGSAEQCNGLDDN